MSPRDNTNALQQLIESFCETKEFKSDKVHSSYWQEEPCKMSFYNAAIFIGKLTNDHPNPDIDCDNRGEINMEWYKSGCQTLYLSFLSEGTLAYSCKLPEEDKCCCGEIPFEGTVPDIIDSLIRQVFKKD